MKIPGLNNLKVVTKDGVTFDDLCGTRTRRHFNEIVIDSKTGTIYVGLNGIFVGYYKQDKANDKSYPLRGQQTNESVHKILQMFGFDGNWGVYDVCDFNTIAEKQKINDIPKKFISWINGKDVDIKGFEYFRPDKNAKNELGVELELETERGVSIPRELKQQIADNSPLIDNIGSDCSVFGDAIEIRFGHPSLKNWKFKDVKKILDTMKLNGATTDYDSAGMHIHISHKYAKKCIERFASNLNIMQDILYPINCRHKYKRDWDRGDKNRATSSRVSYGTGVNIYHDQYGSFGTLEIRAWRATLDPKMFMARLRFAKKLMDYLASNKPISIRDFFKSMTESQKNDYLFMLESPENPHEWGKKPATIKKMLLAA